MEPTRYKYQQLRHSILERIVAGELKHNERLPSERDLAREWGMSALTVRKALSQLEKDGYLTRRVGDGTYIQEVAPETGPGGAPNAESTRYVVMLINDLSGLILHLTHQIEERFSRLGYHIVLKNLHHSFEETLRILKTLDENDVCGFIFNPIYSLYYEYENTELCRAMERFGRPIVMFDNYVKSYECPFVVTDNFKGGYEATEYLIQQGHKRIALVWGDRDTASTDRIRGYQQALEDHNLFGDDGMIIRCQYKEALTSGTNPCTRVYERLLSQPNPPSAIFAMDDYLAHYTLEYCQERGLAVPGEMAIVGFDDFLPSQITTVKQDVELLAENSVGLFIDLLNGVKPADTRHMPPRMR